MKKLKEEPKLLPKEDFFRVIEPGTEKILFAPWNGVKVPIKVVMLSSVALNSCGDFTSVVLPKAGLMKNSSTFAEDLEIMLKIKNMHENILRLALVEPTFDELHTYILGKDFVKKRQADLDRINKLIPKLEDDTLIKKYNEEAQRLEIMLGFLLPEDFMVFVVNYILQRENTDIDNVTKKCLLEAGFLGEKYNQRPSSFIEGTFTEKQRVDIDVAALGEVHEYREAEKMKKGKLRWVGRR